jgi:uncharacterized protein YpiB (UPF0302 family)
MEKGKKNKNIRRQTLGYQNMNANTALQVYIKLHLCLSMQAPEELQVKIHASLTSATEKSK